MIDSSYKNHFDIFNLSNIIYTRDGFCGAIFLPKCLRRYGYLLAIIYSTVSITNLIVVSIDTARYTLYL